MAAEQDDVLSAIEEHTKAVDGSLGGMKKTIETLEKRLKSEAEEREQLERKVNMLRVTGAGGKAVDPTAPELFKKTLGHWYPSRHQQLNDLDYPAYAKAFDQYLRGGQQGCSAEQLKALHVGSDTDGGYLAPIEWAHELIRIERANSVMRSVARTLQAGAGTLSFPAALTKFAVGWVGEQQGRLETNAATLGAKSFETKELYAAPQATQMLLDDAMFDLEGFIREEIGLSFAEEEDAQYIGGDGVLKPRGFTTYDIATTTDAAGTRPWGTIQYVATGQAGAWPTTDAAIYDKLVDLVHSLRPRYRRRAQWLMPTEAIAKLRKMKDGQNNPIWQPSMTEGQPDRLLGYPVNEAEQMPAIGANSLSVAFADWQRAYWIVDRLAVRLLRDPYTSKPNVIFYTTKRTTGGVADSSAIKLLKFAAT